MLTTLEIENYRAFRFLRAELGRINLIAGANGSGKTSLLEALFLLASGGNAISANGVRSGPARGPVETHRIFLHLDSSRTIRIAGDHATKGHLRLDMKVTPEG